jgi:hypothetical protein
MAVEINTDGGGNGGGNTVMGFLLGAVLIAVAIVGFFMWDNYKSGGQGPSAPNVHVTVKK